MQKKNISFSKIPDTPGVYIFRNAKKKILYIGKATSLRNRVRSYFSSTVKSRGPIIIKMVEDANSLEWQETDSVLEALILEVNLIKKHQPISNSRDKDNKSFNYIVITKEDFPKVLVVRGRDLFVSWKERDIKHLFGPFPSGGVLKEGLKIIRKILPFSDKCERGAKKPCFNRQIGLCPGVCSDVISKTDYARNIRHIKMLFDGKKGDLVKSLEKEMKTLSKSEKFEEAAEIKHKVFALTHIRETALLGSDYKVSEGGGSGRIEAYDVAHISETARVGVMVVLIDGEVSKKDYRKFNIKTEKQGDTAALEEILRRRFEHVEWSMPSLIIIDGGVAQKNSANRILDEYGYKVPVINVVKNEKHQAGRIVGNSSLIEKNEKSILLANSEAHRFAISFHRQKRGRNLV